MTTYSSNEKHSVVAWPHEKILQHWKIPDGMLEDFLKILEKNYVDLEKVSIKFYGLGH